MSITRKNDIHFEDLPEEVLRRIFSFFANNEVGRNATNFYATSKAVRAKIGFFSPFAGVDILTKTHNRFKEPYPKELLDRFNYYLNGTPLDIILNLTLTPSVTLVASIINPYVGIITFFSTAYYAFSKSREYYVACEEKIEREDNLIEDFKNFDFTNQNLYQLSEQISRFKKDFQNNIFYTVGNNIAIEVESLMGPTWQLSTSLNLYASFHPKKINKVKLFSTEAEANAYSESLAEHVDEFYYQPPVFEVMYLDDPLHLNLNEGIDRKKVIPTRGILRKGNETQMTFDFSKGPEFTTPSPRLTFRN